MAKYVLLAFDNDDEADSFTSTIVDAGIASSLTVAGVYKRPTMLCECPGKDDKSVRGTKWGWWLHKGCGKPKRGNVLHPWNLLFPGERLTDHPYIGIRAE
jgi:hypothetical protein